MDLLIQQALKSLEQIPEKYRETSFPLLLNHLLTSQRLLSRPVYKKEFYKLRIYQKKL